MRSYISRLVKAVAIGMAACCLMTACDSVSNDSAEDKSGYGNHVWKCPEGQISKAFLAPMVTESITDSTESSTVRYASSMPGGGRMEDYESVCFDREQAREFTAQHLPQLHADIIEDNASVDQLLAGTSQIIATIKAKTDLVLRLFSAVRYVCEQRYLYPANYHYTYIVDASNEVIDKIIAAYKERAQLETQNPFARPGVALSGPEAAYFGKKGRVAGLYEQAGDIYIESWGDAYELFHTDTKYRHLRAGDFPTRNFDDMIEQEC